MSVCHRTSVSGRFAFLDDTNNAAPVTRKYTRIKLQGFSLTEEATIT